MQTVISVFENRQAAQRAVDRLLEAGFEPDDVHLQLGAAAANTVAAPAPGSTGDGAFDRDRGVLASISQFFARLFGQHQPSAGYADRLAEAVRRGHPAIMVDAQDEEAVDRASTILHEYGAFDIDERIPNWRIDKGVPAGTSSSTGAAMGTGQKMQAQRADRRGVHVIDRATDQRLRDLIRRGLPPARSSAGVINRPASTEGEPRVIDRTEGERAMAANQPYEKREREGDIEAREAREARSKPPGE